MEFNTRYLLIVGIIFCGLIVESHGHSYVTSPQSRSNQKQSQSGCRGPACLGPCDAPVASMRGAVATYKRGDEITVQWPRNNHAGGFIRFAWAQTSRSDSASAFDTHVQQINCHEVGGCGPSNPSDPNGGDNGAGDGSFKPCQTTIIVPGDLTDGAWTLQWAWFGGAFALGDYYSCMDFTISGGPVSTLIPQFVGGDYANPNQPKCKFFNADQLHLCVNEPCNGGNYPNSAQQTGIPAFLQKNADGSLILVNGSTPTAPVVTPTPNPIPTPTPTPVPAPTPARPSTTTTGRASTSTTAKSSTSTTAKVSTSTSGKASTSTTTTGSSSTSCGVGQMKCLTSETFSMCVYGAWGPSMSCAPGTTCQPLGNSIQCGWPINS